MVSRSTFELIEAAWLDFKSQYDEGRSNANAVCEAMAISELDVDIQALESLQRSIAERLLHLRRARNSRSPLESLPGELFVNILLWSIDITNWDIKDIQKLAGVSKYWLHTILSTPYFWPVLDLSLGERLLNIISKRNHSAPIAVWCSPAATIPTEPFMTSMKQISSRWRTLAFCSDYSDSHLASIESPTPILRDLFVEFLRGPAPRPIDLAGGVSLQHVDLSGASLHWNSPRLTRLRSLRISSIWDNLPTISQLLTILSSSPELRRLVLEDLSWPNSSADADCPDPLPTPLTLPLLSTFVLRLISRTYCRYLSTNINAPNCKCAVLEDAPIDSLIIDTPLSSLVNQFLDQYPRVVLTYQEANQTLVVSTSPAPLLNADSWIHWGDDTPGLLLTAFATDLGGWKSLLSLVTAKAQSVYLCLRGPGQGPVEPPLTSFPIDSLLNLPCIKALDFSSAYPAGPLLRRMGSPSPNREGNLAWPLPHLHTLKLDSYDSYDAMLADLVAFAETRYAPPTGDTDTSGSIPPPDELDSLTTPLDVPDIPAVLRDMLLSVNDPQVVDPIW
ncbi:hypothetical protein FRB99_001641 [Tulasnella sp. 403]|nr:hypothetical protein FRB99_001641 [Tulasnella sp. 403]